MKEDVDGGGGVHQDGPEVGGGGVQPVQKSMEVVVSQAVTDKEGVGHWCEIDNDIKGQRLEIDKEREGQL